MSQTPALASVAASLRRLFDLCVSVDAPDTILLAAAERLEGVAAALQAHVPDTPLPRYPGVSDPADPADFFPYDWVLGRYSPLAPPLQVEWAAPKAIGRVAFGRPYEGPPGCVHGGMIAAAFDQLFNIANMMSGVAGPTARLELAYRRPTPLFADLVFEAWVEEAEERKVRTTGHLLAGGVVTAEARGLFIRLSPERVMKMLG